VLEIPDLGILADDLTGACDAAAAFAPRVGPVGVCLVPPHRGGEAGTAALTVLNTQSRLLPPWRSRLRVARAARRFAGRAVIFKKIDSVLRGPVGAELEAIARVFPRHPILVLPAVPEMGKTTRGGRLYERGRPAQETDYGGDPLSPLRTNDIREIIRSTGRAEYAIADVETQEDIFLAVGRALENRQALLVGSVGLADELARRVRPVAREAPERREPGRTLVLNGSLYPSARDQMLFAASAYGEEVLYLKADVDSTDLLERCRGKTVAFLQLDAGEPAAPREARRSYSALFSRAKLIIRSYDPDALGIVGGETAYRILRLLGATRLEVEGREQPGLPFGRICDGALGDRAFATKGGSVGSPDACARMVACLGRRGKDA
jgi:D-threonate/D-erythronate kinase